MSEPLTQGADDGAKAGTFTLRAVDRRDPTPDLALIRVSGRFEGTARSSPYLVWVHGTQIPPVIPPVCEGDDSEEWWAEFPIASSRLEMAGSKLRLLLPDRTSFDLPAPPRPDGGEAHDEADAPAGASAEPGPDTRRRSWRGVSRWLATAAGLMIGGWLIAYALQGVDGSSPPAAAGQPARAEAPRSGAVAAGLAPSEALAQTPAGMSLVARAVARRVLLYKSPTATRTWRFLHHPNATGTPTVFLVEAASGDRFKVRLPVHPNGATAWIRRVDVRLELVRYRLGVDLTRHRLTVWRDGRRFMGSTIGVGRSITPTPSGVYYVTALLKQPDPDGIYGPYAFALSGHSNVLDEFAGGDGRIGIHGTNEPSGIGSDVSHGCIRVPNTVIRRLARLLPLGTPVRISR